MKNSTIKFIPTEEFYKKKKQQRSSKSDVNRCGQSYNNGKSNSKTYGSKKENFIICEGRKYYPGDYLPFCVGGENVETGAYTVVGEAELLHVNNNTVRVKGIDMESYIPETVEIILEKDDFE